MTISQEYLKSILRYEPDTGVFTRLIATTNSVKVGDVAGDITPDGYIRIRVKGRRYSAHRLAFIYMKGAFPDDQVDHINQIKNDNAWENLRACTQSQNQGNAGTRRDNTSGYKGVSWHKRRNKWMAAMKVEGKSIHLGYFEDLNEAARAYNQAALKYFGEYAYLNEIPESKDHEISTR